MRSDDRGAHAEGIVLDASGRLLVRTSQRARWAAIEGRRDPHMQWDEVITADDDVAFDDLLRSPGSPAGAYLLRSDRASSNNMGVVHGGTSISAAAAVAEAALAEGSGEPLRITSLRIHYPRPSLAGSRIHVEPAVRYRGRSFGVVDVVTRADGADRTLTRITAEA
jgi:hypothetical protein